MDVVPEDVERATAWAARGLDVELAVEDVLNRGGRCFLHQAATVLVARQLHAGGYTPASIARALGYTRQAIHRMLARIPPRRSSQVAPS